MRAAVRHRRGLVTDRKRAQQRLHDQLNALCPGLSAPAGHGRSLPIETPTGQAVLAVRGRLRGPPAVDAITDRPSPGKLTRPTADYWANAGVTASPPPDAGARATRLGSDLDRYRSLLVDVRAVEDEITVLLGPYRGPGPDQPPRRRAP
jgi:hypothetical protein